MNAQDTSPIHLDLLHRIAATLFRSSGVKPERASALAWHHLWFDVAGLPKYGLSQVPVLLDQLDRNEVVGKAEGKVRHERGATAVFDGMNGPSSLVLARAAEIAVEKAREFGTGLVHVRGLGRVESAAPVVADIAVGPMVGTAWGPEGAWSVAVPAAMGQPLIFDSVFASSESPGVVPSPWSPFTFDGEWVIQAVSVKAIEPLTSLHARVARTVGSVVDGRFSHERLESSRRNAHEHGLAIAPDLLRQLQERATRLGVLDAF